MKKSIGNKRKVNILFGILFFIFFFIIGIYPVKSGGAIKIWFIYTSLIF